MDSQKNQAYRKIIHIDMDAFYASVEQRDFPEYRGKPIAVGGSPEGRGGVVATASYEARLFGIRSAMSSKKALQLCPHLVFVRPRFEVYKEASRRLREIFSRYTELIEPLSLDEAFLDVTHDKLQIGSAIEIARNIKEAIKNELGLTASAGISVNKFVAKIASDMQKPDGLTFVGPSRIESFIESLPVEKFFGVGKVTARKLKLMGIHTGADIKKLNKADLHRSFGKMGLFFHDIARGIDNREVKPHREPQSIGAEDTFEEDLTEQEIMNSELERIAVVVYDRLSRKGLKAKTVTLKIKYSDFKIITRGQSSQVPLGSREEIAAIAQQLLASTAPEGKRIRLLGITCSNFEQLPSKLSFSKVGQLRLF